MHRADLRPGERDLLDRLVAVYLGRLPPELAADRPATCTSPGRDRPARGPGTTTGSRRDDLLIEFDNTTDDGNHAHTVLRRPRGDFGGDVLAAHRAGASLR